MLAFSQDQLPALPALPLQYVDFAQWQRLWLSDEVLARQLAYWQQQLAMAPPLLELPTDRPRPAIQSFTGRQEPFEIELQLVVQLRSLSRENAASLFMTLYAAFAVLLSRYSGQDDIVVGTPLANRHYQGMESLIGFFVNTLPLRVDLSDRPNFEALLQQVRQITLEANSHQDIPLEQLISELAPERHLSYSPLFQVMFALENTVPERVTLGDLQVAPVALEMVTSKFDLTLLLEETEAERGLRGLIEYSTDLFERETIQRMIGHFQQVLAGIVAHPQQPVDTLPLLSEAERQQIVVAWNDTRTSYPDDHCIHHLFEHQVAQRPDAIAVVFEETCLTYSQLNRRANQLAHYLQDLGVGPEVIVGLCLERSLDMVVGVLGILKAGGAYLPLDPAYPSERLAFMLADTQAPVILTQQQVRHQVPDTGAEIIGLDTAWEHLAHQSSDPPAPPSPPSTWPM